MKKNDYISLSTAKLLKDCELPSEFYWLKPLEEPYLRNFKTLARCGKFELMDGAFPTDWKHYHAYSFYEIIVTHAKEFFGRTIVCNWCGAIQPDKEIYDNDWGCDKLECDREDMTAIYNYEYRSRQIMEQLQDGKNKEAEAYFIKHCILLKK